MKKPNSNCRETAGRLAAYFDGQLPAAAAEEFRRHLQGCPGCAAILRDFSSIRQNLSGLAWIAGEGGEISLWPAVRAALREEQGRSTILQARKKFSYPFRPAWVGFGLAAAAAWIIFFSGILSEEELPKNYCRIEAIAAPENNLIIHRGESDGLTIIWLAE